MNLDPNIAKAIVDNLKDVINYDINLFNIEGEIIASTNRARVGGFHYGSKIAADTKRILEVTYDEEFRGSKKGLNIPIIFNDTVAAVIGITGEKDQVAPYGNIIKKMTEILLRENFSQMVSFNTLNHFRDLSTALLTKFQDDELINYLAEILDIDLNIPRRIIVGKVIDGSNKHSQSIESNPLTQLLKIYLYNDANSFYWIKDNDLILFLDMESIEQTVSFLETISSVYKNKYDSDLYFGISTLQQVYSTYWIAAEEAETALKWNEFNNSFQSIHKTLNYTTSYETIMEGMFFTNLSLDKVQEYLCQVFTGIPPEMIEEFCEFFDVYIRVNGSITKGANELFIHKNTFQNKLNLIYEKTGYNPRNLEDFPVLWLGFNAYKWLTFNNAINSNC